jgi:hypothetical protein
VDVGLDGDGASGGGRLYRVQDQVEDRVLELEVVGDDEGRAALERQHQADALLASSGAMKVARSVSSDFTCTTSGRKRGGRAKRRNSETKLSRLATSLAIMASTA